MKEFDLINKFLKPLSASKNLSRGLLDDTASISIKNPSELIVSKDILVEDTHFKLSDQAYNIAYKALQVNLSDIASSGAKPIGYLLGIGKNSKLADNFFHEFCRGLKDVQKEFNIHLYGGDTVNSPINFFSITIFAKTLKNQILIRKNAKSGDLIFVSGTIGDAGLGLELLKQNNQQNNQKYRELILRHLRPTARIKLGEQLLKNKISKSAIDISDGLLADIEKICMSAKLDAEIFTQNIPISKSAINFLKNNQQYPTQNLLISGDDYELAFSVKSKDLQKILDLSKKLTLNLTCIGQFKKPQKNNKPQILFKNSVFYEKIFKSNNIKFDLTKLKNFGYEHN